MNPPDVEPIEMTRATVVDREIQALLDGRPPVLDDALAAELGSLRDRVSGSLPLPMISETMRDAHLTRMMAAFVPASTVQMTPQANLRDRAKAALSRRVAAATLAFTAAFGGAAYAGVLPAPLQDAASSVASAIGIDIPSSGSDDETGAPDDSMVQPEDDSFVPDALDDLGDEERTDDVPTGKTEDRNRDEVDARQDDGDDAADRRDDVRDATEDREDDVRDDAEDSEDAADDGDDARGDADDSEDDADDERDGVEDASDEDRDDAAAEDDGGAEDVQEDAADEAEEREDGAEDAEDVGQDELDASQDSTRRGAELRLVSFLPVD